jgi:steroid delta-isomerase
MATATDIRATIDGYIENFSGADRDGWLALFAEDATLEDPVGAEVKVGHAGLLEFWDFVHSLAENITLYPAGPACVAAPEAAFPITIVNQVGDTKMVIDAIDHMTFTDDAKIATMRAFWDLADMRGHDPARDPS